MIKSQSGKTGRIVAIKEFGIGVMNQLGITDPDEFNWKLGRSILEKNKLVDDFTRLGKYKDHDGSFRLLL